MISIVFKDGTGKSYNIKSYEEKNGLLQIILDNGNKLSLNLIDIKKYKVYGEKK